MLEDLYREVYVKGKEVFLSFHPSPWPSTFFIRPTQCKTFMGKAHGEH